MKTHATSGEQRSPVADDTLKSPPSSLSQPHNEANGCRIVSDEDDDVRRDESFWRPPRLFAWHKRHDASPIPSHDPGISAAPSETPALSAIDEEDNTLSNHHSLPSLQLRPHGPKRNHWIAVLFGQGIALIAASMNATSFTLVQSFGVQTQLFQLSFIYIFLVMHLFYRQGDDGNTTIAPLEDDETNNDRSSIDHHSNAINDSRMLRTSSDIVTGGTVEPLPHSYHCRRRHYHLPCFPNVRLRQPCWLYFCYSLVDVIPNFMSLVSYRYSSLTSTTLLSSLTVPSTMLFSRCILRKVFGGHHYVGVLLCVLGGTLTVYVDAFGNSSSSGGGGGGSNGSTSTANALNESMPASQSYIGDALAIASAILYGLGDCIAEYSVKNVDRNEYLGMLGLFGLVLTGLATPLVEYDAVTNLWQTISTSRDAWPVLGLLTCYVTAVCLYYVTEARFLIASDATLLNLSMQSVSLWVYIFTLTNDRVQQHAPPTFFVALLLVGSGVFLYEMGFCVCHKPNAQRPRSRSFIEIVPDEQDRVVNYQTLVTNTDTRESI